MVASRGEVAIVSLAVVLAFALVLAVLVAFPSRLASTGGRSACGQESPIFEPLMNLTPATPFLLPQGSTYSASQGVLYFCILAPIELRGSWNSSAPVSLGVFNAHARGETWGPPGAFVSNGSLNLTLFPGTYAIVLQTGVGELSTPVLTATQPIRAVFDLSLSVLQAPGTLGLPPAGYLAWPLWVSLGPSIGWLNGSISTLGCDVELAILTTTLYESFLTNRSAIQSTGVVVLDDINATHYCSPDSLTSYLFAIDGLGPVSFPFGDTLVFFNAGPFPIQFSVVEPLEIAYVPPP